MESLTVRTVYVFYMFTIVCHVERVETFQDKYIQAQATVMTNCHQFKANHGHDFYVVNHASLLYGILGKQICCY